MSAVAGLRPRPCCPVQAIIYPLELIRTRLAVSPTGTYRGIAHCAEMVLRQEGWRAFYRGLVPSMVRISTSQNLVCYSLSMLLEARASTCDQW